MHLKIGFLYDFSNQLIYVKISKKLKIEAYKDMIYKLPRFYMGLNNPLSFGIRNSQTFG